MLMYISLNAEEYEKIVGKLPDVYLKGCIVDALNESDAIIKYWYKAGGTGGLKQKEKTRKKLFRFELL